MGRSSKPLGLQISQGDPARRGKPKLLDAAERKVQPAMGLPNCPLHLKGRARLAWRFLRHGNHPSNVGPEPLPQH